MLIPPEEAGLFFKLYPSLIGFAAGRIDGAAGIVDAHTFRSASNEARAEARDRMLDNTGIIGEFIKKNPDEFREQELAHVAKWKDVIRGRFVVERDLRKYTIFLDDSEPARAYGVLGLTDEIVDMLPFGLPAYVEAVLLPWMGMIICDGLIRHDNLIIGRGLADEFKEAYRHAKARGIITSLDPDWQPEPPKPARKAKTPAIVRFLKKCPKTVAEFKRKYGEPRMDMGKDAAREYSVWCTDGTPALDIDYVMLYANIIRHQVLYVYAKEGNITHIAVVDPTDWRRGDFKPHGGNRLLR